jgi:hypothetical protein
MSDNQVTEVAAIQREVQKATPHLNHTAQKVNQQM